MPGKRLLPEPFEWARREHKYVLFDVDGTLLKSRSEAILAAVGQGVAHLNRFLAEQGLSVRRTDFFDDVLARHTELYEPSGQGVDARLGFKLYLDMAAGGKLSDRVKDIEVENAYRLYEKELRERPPVFEDVAEALKRVREAGFTPVAFTNRIDEEALHQLEAEVAGRKLLEEFHAVIVTDPQARLKRGIGRPMTYLGMPKGEKSFEFLKHHLRPHAVFGDSMFFDIQPAEKAGIPAFHVRQNDVSLLEAVERFLKTKGF